MGLNDYSFSEDLERRADWEKWRRMGSVALWQAVALSFDVEPESLAGIDWRPLSGGGEFDNCQKPFQDRLEIAKNHLAKHPWDTAENELDWQRFAANANHTSVNLVVFCTWAERPHQGWRMPNKFPRAARPSPQRLTTAERLASASLDWNKWRFMKDAPLWQVVSLSLDTSPDYARIAMMTGDWQAPEDRFNGFRDQYRNRLAIAVNWLAKTSRDIGPDFLRCDYYIPDPSAGSEARFDTQTSEDSVVDLEAFSAWAEKSPRNWKLPDEFPRAPSPAAPPSTLTEALNSASFYVSPYLSFMVRAAEALNLSATRKQHDHGAIKEWLQKEWKDLKELENVPKLELEATKAQYIVTLITPPEHQKGGANPSGANILPVTARIAPRK